MTPGRRGVVFPTTPAPRAKPTRLWGTGTILLVEDEEMVRTVAERALSRQAYKVIAAGNGQAALGLLMTSPRPDPLISDVVMPILFMSGYAEEHLRRSIDFDRVAFLPKPFSVQQLAEAARDALAPRG